MTTHGLMKSLSRALNTVETAYCFVFIRYCTQSIPIVVPSAAVTGFVWVCPALVEGEMCDAGGFPAGCARYYRGVSGV